MMKETHTESSNLIDGKAIAAAVNRETALRVADIGKQYGAVPGLAVILVGDNPASQVYVNTKVRKCAELGICSEKIVLPKETTQTELLEVIDRLNRKPTIHGILVQSPPPPQSTASMAEPATAIVAPTEMSCPPVAAVTSVMPMARMASSEPLFRMEISWPERTGLPVLS